MNKRNEGYALPFVLVVMIVLCLVSVSVLSFSLRNLQSQQTSIDRMQAQYEAEGEIEKAVAILESKDALTGFGMSYLTDAYRNDEVTYTGLTYEDDVLSFNITVKHPPVQIDCTIQISGTIESAGNELYNVTSPVITYTSYEITAEGGADQ